MPHETPEHTNAANACNHPAKIDGEQPSMDDLFVLFDKMHNHFDEMDKHFQEMNATLDRIEAAQARLIYWLLGVGAVLLASILVTNLTG